MAAQKFAEVVGTPYAVWVAPTGTAFPAVDAAPGTPWAQLGVNGTQNQGDKGVTVNFAETINDFRPAGSTYKVKSWRTAEDPTVAFSVVDTTVELVSAILDSATITTVAASSSVAATKSIKTKRSFQVSFYSLLVRGLSPYDDGTGLTAQWQFTRVCQTGNQSIAYVPGTPAEVDCEFSVYDDVSGVDPGLYIAETAAHS